MYLYIFSFEVLNSCLCFDPSAPVDSRISRIADMNYARYNHSLVVANEKMYAIGGWIKICIKFITFIFYNRFYNISTHLTDDVKYIEEYDPNVNEWKFVGEIDLEKLQ